MVLIFRDDPHTHTILRKEKKKDPTSVFAKKKKPTTTVTETKVSCADKKIYNLCSYRLDENDNET